MSSLKESTNNLDKILQTAENDETWKLSQQSGVKPPAGSEEKTKENEEKDKMKEEEEGESDEEEEEEESDEDLGFEIKLDTTATDPKKHSSFTPISLQQNAKSDSQTEQTENNNRTLVPTPSQNRENIFDAEYLETGDRPWNKPGADITDYFNYGFTDKTWEAYHYKQKKKRMAHSMKERIGVYEASTDDSTMDLPPEISGNRSSSYSQQDSRSSSSRGNRDNRSSSSSSSWQDPRDSRSSHRRRPDDDIVHLGGDNHGDEYTITPDPYYDSRDHRDDRRRPSPSVRRDREHSSSRRSRDDRRSGSREMEREPRDDRRRSRDDDRRRDYRDERITGKKRSDYSRGPESDRKRSRHH